MSTSPIPYDDAPHDDQGSPPRIGGPAFRTLPHNIEAERGLLGAILVDNRAHEKVAEYLSPEHFVTGQHKLIFDACVRSEEHTSELQSRFGISYAVVRLKKKNHHNA